MVFLVLAVIYLVFGVDSYIIPQQNATEVADEDEFQVIVNKPFTIYNGSTKNFWTEERIREALKNPISLQWRTYNETRMDVPSSNRTKRQASGRGFLPVLDDSYFRTMGIEIDPKRVRASANNMAAPVKVADTSKLPFSSYGKLLIGRGGVATGHCSAQVVGHPGVIMTAAHCVQDEQGGLDRFGFHTSNGRSVLVVGQCTIKKEYARYTAGEHGDVRYDYAFCSLKPGHWASGYLNIDFNGPSQSTVVSAGYPRNFYDGERLVFTEGRSETHADRLICMPKNPMTQGCSGGAWVQGSGSSWTVVGLNSFVYRDSLGRPTVGMYSPLFNADTRKAFLHAKGSLTNNGNGEHGETLEPEPIYPPIPDIPYPESNESSEEGTSGTLEQTLCMLQASSCCGNCYGVCKYSCIGAIAVCACEGILL